MPNHCPKTVQIVQNRTESQGFSEREGRFGEPSEESKIGVKLILQSAKTCWPPVLETKSQPWVGGIGHFRHLVYSFLVFKAKKYVPKLSKTHTA